MWAMECGVVSFHELGVSYANEWEDHSNNWKTTLLGLLIVPWNSGYVI